MTTTAFDTHIRTLECTRCGAPFATHQRGGEVTCAYCGAVNVVASRRAAEHAGVTRTLADEVARLSRLKAQLVNPISAHAYDLHQPPMGYSRADFGEPAGLERARNEWQRARTAPPSPVPEEQRKLCWLALQLAESYRQQREPLKARAVLETALEVLPDAGHRHLVRCRLAITAIQEHDLESAAGWLAECDAYPEVLELDSAYREAQAMLHAGRGDAPALLHVVGARESDIPIAPEQQRSIAMLRVHGLELAGHANEADRELARAGEQFGHEPLRRAMESRRLAPATVQRATRHALEAKLEDLRNQRAATPSSWVEAMAPMLGMLPFMVGILMIPVSVTRCTLDADPLLGSYGYPLCPQVCEGCHGPVRVVTAWHQTGPGEYSSDGAEYFCAPEGYGLELLSDDAMESSRASLAPYQMSFLTAIGATYLMLALLLLPLVPIRALVRWQTVALRLRVLEEDMQTLAAELGVRAPLPAGLRVQPLLRALRFNVLVGGVAAVFVLLGLTV